MNKSSKTTKTSGNSIVFLGSGPVAAKSLDFLSDHFVIEAVITKAVPSHHKGTAPVEELAKNKNLALLFANNKTELDTLIHDKQFKSRLGVVVDFGVIISQESINAFELGILNSHFSLLPEWRGADPITFAVLSGQSKTGVSLMLIEPTLDTGKILVQKSFPLTQETTTPSLTDDLINLSNSLLVEYIPRYFAGTIKPRSQPHPDRATHSRKLTKEDGRIDWGKPAEEIEREIRAFQGWPGSYTELAGKEVTITKAHALPTTNADTEPGKVTVVTEGKKVLSLMVQCGTGSLCIDELKPAGKNKMTSQAFVAGHKDRLLSS